MASRVLVVALTGPAVSPHAGRWVRHWNPHTRFGVCEIETTDNPDKARIFRDAAEVMAEWNTVSDVQPVRPDGRLNKPLTGMSIQIETLRSVQ